MNSDSLTRILDLSIAERIQLVEDIWDSPSAEQAQIPLSAAQQSELEERQIGSIEALPGAYHRGVAAKVGAGVR